ncbi:unnamed protein product [Ectocarpus sp. 8 AP-2014]
MGSLHLKRGLGASLLARSSVIGRRRAAAAVAPHSSASLRAPAAECSRTFVQPRLRQRQQRRPFGTTAEFEYKPLFQYGATPRDEPTEYRKLSSEGVSVVKGPDGQEFLKVAPEALRLLCSTAMVDIAHLLRSNHLRQLANILEDPEVMTQQYSAEIRLGSVEIGFALGLMCAGSVQAPNAATAVQCIGRSCGGSEEMKS